MPIASGTSTSTRPESSQPARPWASRTSHQSSMITGGSTTAGVTDGVRSGAAPDAAERDCFAPGAGVSAFTEADAGDGLPPDKGGFEAVRLAGDPKLGAAVLGTERRVGKECRSRWSPYH